MADPTRLVHGSAKGRLTIDGAEGPVMRQRPALDAMELTIVSKAPGSSPELAQERMGVGDRDAPAVGATDMPYRDATGDRVLD